MVKYFDINAAGHSIKCKLFTNDQRNITELILFGHGFGGHKDTKAAENLAVKAMAKNKKVSLMSFDWPCHGKDVKKKMSLADCMTYMDLVLEYIDKVFGSPRLYLQATSFGGYCFLKYMHDTGRHFNKVALRCPALNMYESLTGTIMRHDEYDLIRKGKEAEVGFDRKVRVGESFLKELEASDIRTYDYTDFAEEILILHGTKDEIIPFDVSSAFADDNVIEFIPVENADHRFRDPDIMDKAISTMIKFYEI